MALHERLFDDLTLAINGSNDVNPVEATGSFNYKGMSWGTACVLALRGKLSDDRKNRKGIRRSSIDDFMSFLSEQERVGHCSLEGPKGVACEQGSPGMHFSFVVAAVGGVLQEALYNPDTNRELISACVRWFGYQAQLNSNFRVGSVVAMPCPRVKDEKQQSPVDGYRDLLTALLLDSHVDARGSLILPSLARRAGRFWQEKQATGVRVLRDILIKQPYILHDIRNTSYPKLYLPINKKDLVSGGYIAWIDKTDEAVKVMGKDVCNWIVNRPNGKVDWGYDWSPVPQID